MMLQFTEIDNEISNIFCDIGMKSNESRVLVLFFKAKDLTSREIERIVDIRQPEVSIALTQLIKRQWVQVTNHLSENKGRPVKIYNLLKSVDEILDQMKSDIDKNYQNKIKNLERVKLLVQESREMVYE